MHLLIFRVKIGILIQKFNNKAFDVANDGLLVENLIGFLIDELSGQVPLGNQHLYIRFVLNPIFTLVRQTLIAQIL